MKYYVGDVGTRLCIETGVDFTMLSDIVLGIKHLTHYKETRPTVSGSVISIEFNPIFAGPHYLMYSCKNLQGDEFCSKIITINVYGRFEGYEPNEDEEFFGYLPDAYHYVEGENGEKLPALRLGDFDLVL